MKKELSSMIVIDEILMKRVKLEDLSNELQDNAKVLLSRLNEFRKAYGKPMYVSSGYRSPNDNNNAGGAKRSAHMTLEACDFKDDGQLFDFIKNNPDILEQCDLYLEDPRWTPTWIHLQIRPASKRIFIPYKDKEPIDITREIK